MSSTAALVHLRAARLIYVRACGDYAEIIPQTWQTMLALLSDHGIVLSTVRFIGLSRDNPAKMDRNSCRFDACVVMDDAVEDLRMLAARHEAGVQMMPSGPFIRQRSSGSQSDLSDQVSAAYASFNPPVSLRLDYCRPVVTMPIGQEFWQTGAMSKIDLCMPVVIRTAREKIDDRRVAA